MPTVHNCDGAWAAGNNCTSSNETTDRREGTGCIKLVTSSSSDPYYYKDSLNVNVSSDSRLHAWIKCSAQGNCYISLWSTRWSAGSWWAVTIGAENQNKWIFVDKAIASPDATTGTLNKASVAAVRFDLPDVHAQTSYIDYIYTDSKSIITVPGVVGVHTTTSVGIITG